MSEKTANELGDERLQSLITGPMIAAYYNGEHQSRLVRDMVESKLHRSGLSYSWLMDCIERNDPDTLKTLLVHSGNLMTLDRLCELLEMAGEKAFNTDVILNYIDTFHDSIVDNTVSGKTVENLIDRINKYLSNAVVSKNSIGTVSAREDSEKRKHGDGSLSEKRVAMSRERGDALTRLEHDVMARVVQLPKVRKTYLSHCVKTDNHGCNITAFLNTLVSRVPEKELNKLLEQSVGKSQVMAALMAYKDSLSNKPKPRVKKNAMDDLWKELEDAWALNSQGDKLI